MQDAPLLATRAGAAPGSDELNRVQRVRAAGAIALTALPFLLLWPTTESLLLRWQDTVARTYTHGSLIAALSLWLLWRGRARWTSVPAQVCMPGAALLLAGSLVWLIAYRSGLQIVHQALLPLLSLAAVLTCFGWPLALRMSLPVGYLYFAIPVWDAINPILQWTSVFAVRLMSRLAGIPAYFAGDTFHIPAGSFEIASGCSGLHFFIVAAAIGVLYGELSRDRLHTRLLLVALAIGLAMATNWVRIFIIVLAGHLTDMQHYLVSGEHYTFGWFMFAGVMLVYFMIVRRWPLAPAPADASGGASHIAVPRAGFVLAIAGMLPVFAWYVLDRNVSESAGRLLPASVSGWSANASSTSDWRPIFRNADAEERMTYRSADSVVNAYGAAYLQQRQEKEVGGYENSILGHELQAQGRNQPATRGWIEQRAKDSRGEDWLVWYAYRLDERWHSKPLYLQLEYGLRSLFSAPLTSVIAVRAPCAGDCATAREALGRFIETAWPNI